MKRIALLLVTISLCSATFLFAGDKNKNNNSTEITGWVCNAKCVDQSPGKATCNANCSETSGKHCKMTAKKNPANPEELDAQNIIETRGP